MLAVLWICLFSWFCQRVQSASLAMVIEGDNYVDVYHNSAFVAPDISATLIPLNGVRRVVASDTPAKVMVFPLGVEQGDVLAFRLVTSRPEVLNVTNALGQTSLYPAPLGVIMASRNGLMSSGDFKCSTQEKALNEERTPFFYREFNDTAWPQAYEQPADCCPWRDQMRIWERLNAKWIGASPLDYPGNISGPRQLNCRYHVPGSDVPSNLPRSEVMMANESAPLLNISGLEISTSVTKITFSVDRRADVYCGVIDSRYELRVPTHNELKQWGSAMMGVAGEIFQMGLIADEFSAFELNASVLVRLDAEDLASCEAQCLSRMACVAMEFYVVGLHTQTGTNCKLLEDSYDVDNRFPESSLASFTQKYKFLAKPQHTMTISGLLFPNTVYNTYCSAEDPATGLHSNWTAVSRTYQTARTGGCFNCGNLVPPDVFVSGGFVGASTIGVVATASEAGRIFCGAFPVNSSGAQLVITADMVREPNFFAILTGTGISVSITVGDLTPQTEYEVACMAESDGGAESTQQQIDFSRRKFSSEEVDTTISSMRISREANLMFDEITVSTQLVSIGYLWCQVFPSENLQELGVPNAVALKEGDELKVADLQELSSKIFTELDRNTSYDVWCTSEFNDFRDDQAGQDLLTPFPKSTILSIESSYYTAQVLVQVTKGPASIFCQAYPWALRPFTQRPAIPTALQLQESPYTTNYMETPNGRLLIEIQELTPGRYYDVYCFSETYVPPEATGADTVAQFGMDAASILETRTQLITLGPFFDDLGWSCVSGRPCNVTDLLPLAAPLSPLDRLFVRSDGCPLRCRCQGVADGLSKGSSCSEISQDPTVQAGVGLTDAKDPRGAWCYVEPGYCPDEERSQVFPQRLLSYKVCTYNMEVGTGATVPGFPNGGLATTVLDGHGFSWGDLPVIAAGRTYDLCWCNGTMSSCMSEADFSVRLGPLHFGGPSASQATSLEVCRAGMPCSVVDFDGQAVENGSRLVVLPLDPRGCRWQRLSEADPPGLTDFPNIGVSETFDQASHTYNFFGEPLIARGGRYNLCWCGPPAEGIIRVPGKDYRQPDGIIPPACPAQRPEEGGAFLSPAGVLQLIGPSGNPDTICRLGVNCVVPQVFGEGLQGSDRVAVLQRCGHAALPPDGWQEGASAKGRGWTSAGWITHGPSLSASMLAAFGAPGSTAPEGVNASDRGIYGFPNMGISVPSSIVGYITWDGPVWAFAGTYQLCWCGADATTTGCKSPSDFLVPFGRLILNGPAVLPTAAQQFRCVRMRQCEIERFEGNMPPTSKIMIASGECGTPAPGGMPLKGQSLPSRDGLHFYWGREAVTADPGKYRLCWCTEGQACILPSDYLSYSGIMQIKFPTSSPLRFFCGLARPCNITNIQGEGLSNEDRVMLLTKCGDGTAEETTFLEGAFSIATYDEGGTFLLPSSSQAVSYQVCWCAAEQTCANPPDFSVSLGFVDFGGPLPDVVYRCFEWEACEIEALDGTALSDGDRLLVVPDGTNCLNLPAGQRGQPGFPLGGVSLPATKGGRRFSWGSGLVRAPVGYYALCWCSNQGSGNESNGTVETTCTEEGPFTVPGGVIRVGSSKEFQFISNSQELPPRAADPQLSWLLAIPLPALFFGAICLGIARVRGRRGGRDAPEAPPLRIAEPNAVLSAQRLRSMLALDSKEVADTRDDISKLMDRGRKNADEKSGLLALYLVFRRHIQGATQLKKQKESKRAASNKPRRLERQGTGLSRSSANSSFARSEKSDYSFKSSNDNKMVSHVPLPPRLDIHNFRSPTANIPGLVDIVEEEEEDFAPLEDIEVEDLDAFGEE